MGRSPRWIVLACAVAWTPGVAVAQNPVGVEQCLDSSEQGQALRDKGQLRAARERFVTCANEACPGLVQKDCAIWLGAVQRRIPSIVLRIRDATGKDVIDAGINVDGEVLSQGLDGKALEIDPGRHVVEVTPRAGKAQKFDVLVREGEKAQRVDLQLRASADKPPAGSGLVGPESRRPTAGSGVPTVSWILGGLGLVAVGGYAYLGLTARSERDDLANTCSPDCPDADVDAVRSRVLFANVAFGVAVVSFGVGTWLWLSAPGDEEAATHRVGGSMSPSGGYAVYQARF